MNHTSHRISHPRTMFAAILAIAPGAYSCGGSTTADADDLVTLGEAAAEITQGTMANAYPWSVLVFTPNMNKQCSGALIKDNVVLTAAHCVTNANDWNVVAPYAQVGGAVAMTAHRALQMGELAIVCLDAPIASSSFGVIAGTAPAQGSKVVHIGAVHDGAYSLAPPNLYASPPVKVHSIDGTSYYTVKAVQPGDSGGPSVAAGTNTIHGVVEGATIDTLGISHAVLTRVDTAAAWISKQAAIGCGLIGQWHLDSNALDASGHGHHGAVSGASPVAAGKFGGAYTFGGGGNIDVGQLSFPNGEYTVALWLKTTHYVPLDDYRMAIGNHDIPAGDATFELVLGDGDFTPGSNAGGNAPVYLVWDAGSTVVISGNDSIASGVNGRDGAWHMVAATYKSGAQAFYIDAILIGGYSYAGTLPVASSVRIGGLDGFGPYHHPWIGEIDEVSIYGRALSASEISLLIQGP